MTKRGKVLRDANAGPGLLMVGGQQYPFSLNGLWKSEMPPKPGMVVEVEFEEDGKIHAISAVAESQLAKEQAEAALAMAKDKGAALASGLVARFGMPTLVAAGLLVISWLFLSAVNVQTPVGKSDFTFWQMLGALNSNNMFETMMQGGRSQPGAGFYGFLALVAIAGPFLCYFWKDKRAALGGLLPLLFMVVVGLMIRSGIQSSLGGDAPREMAALVAQMRAEAMNALSVGFGVYLSSLVSLYFAAIAIKRFLAAQASEKPGQESTRQMAA